MQEGNVVIVAMPQTNGLVKDRPSIILREMPPFRGCALQKVNAQH